MNSSTKISTYDTEDSLYVALARAFGETKSSDGDVRWVTFTTEGVTLTFFAADGSVVA